MSLEYKVLGQGPAVAFSYDPKFVAITASSDISAYSTDGISWTQNVMPSNTYWQDVVYGENKFVSVTSSSSIYAYSTDGINWIPINIGSTAQFGVAYGNGRFVATGLSSVAYSIDGISWGSAALPSGITWTAIGFGNGKFILLPYNSSTAAYSTDGIQWTQSSLPVSAVWQDVIYGNGVFVAVSSSTAAAYSTDGVTWTQSTMPASGWNRIAFGSGRFVALAYDSAAYSDDGITWTVSSIPTYFNWRSLAYSENMFVAIGYNSSIAAYSTDGITWTQTAMPLGARWQSAAYGLIISTIPQTKYTVPALKQSIISSIYVANNSTTTASTYSLAIVPDGETLSDKHYLRKNTLIADSDFEVLGEKITLSAGYSIVTNANSEDVHISVFGVESDII